MSYHDLGMFIGHTSSLGALLEVHQTLVDVGEQEYEARLECAVDVAKLARVAKDGGLVNGCLISAGVSRPVVHQNQTSKPDPDCSIAGPSPLGFWWNILSLIMELNLILSTTNPISPTW